MHSTVRYTGGDDTALRVALLKAWGFKCYWCRHPLDLLGSQIDHILARSLSQDAFAKALIDYGLPATFDRDSVFNLAPICSKCNVTKGNRLVSALGVVAVSLDRACAFSKLVVADVISIRSDPKLAESLTRITESDLSDPRARTLLTTFGPAVIRRLIDVGVPLETRESIQIALDPTRGLVQDVDLTVDADGIATRRVVEEICGSDWREFLTDCVNAVVDQVSRAAVEKIEGIENEASEPVNAGEATFLDRVITIEKINFEWQGDAVTLTVRGKVSAYFACSAVRYADDGSSLLDLQGEGEILSGFTVNAGYSIADPGYPIDVDPAELEEDHSNVWIDF